MLIVLTSSHSWVELSMMTGKHDLCLPYTAFLKQVLRDISVSEIEQAMSDNAVIIEDYPNDKYGPSCLILGYTNNGRTLHIQCSYPSRQLIKIITLYQPDPELWIEDRVRKTK